MFVPSSKPPAASIADLKDIPPLPPVSWALQAPGWWVLLALLIAGLLVFALLKARRWWRNRYRRAAQAELAVLEHAVADPAQRALALAALPSLVKRTVLTWAPRDKVGSLSGDDWLGFLDRTCAGKDFTQGPGRQLEALAYGGGEIGNDDLAALITLLHRWIDSHVPA